MNAEFHRKIGDTRIGAIGIIGKIGRGQHPFFELLPDPVQMGQETVIHSQTFLDVPGKQW